MIAQTPKETQEYQDSGLTPLTEFCYRVRAIGMGGFSNFSGAACVSTGLGAPLELAAPPQPLSSVLINGVVEMPVVFNP